MSSARPCMRELLGVLLILGANVSRAWNDSDLTTQALWSLPIVAVGLFLILMPQRFAGRGRARATSSDRHR